MNAKKGFTLIELLIVIGILAILATTVVLVLNPAQLTAQARDVQRISDLSTLKSAIAIYLSTASSPTVGTSALCTYGTTSGFSTGSGTCATNATTTVDGNGWVGVNFTGTSGGSPIASLPLDPTQSADYYYSYVGDNTNKTFEIDARLESIKYRDQMKTDGGNKNTCPSTYVESTCFYEIGTEPGLDL